MTEVKEEEGIELEEVGASPNEQVEVIEATFWNTMDKKKLKMTIGVLILVAAVLLVAVGAVLFFITSGSSSAGGHHPVSDDLSSYKDPSLAIIERARKNAQQMYDHLAQLADNYPARICGSTNLDNGIHWLQNQWQKENFTNVYLQNVTDVPNWKRNDASLRVLEPYDQFVPILALGNSIATPEGPLQGEILVVKSFDELDARKKEAKGKIVVFNAVFTRYGETVRYRVDGAVHAAKAGAKGSLVRSITPFSLQTPHTGVMRYQSDVPQIPHAAITLETADYFQRMQDQNITVTIEWYQNCESLNDTTSYNVVAEVIGSEKPDEIVLMGGHIDSWDVGTGAMDDGGGVFAAYYALKAIVDLGFTPKRTIRIIGWVDEENSGSGAKAYYNSQTGGQLINHVLAVESDSGTFTPLGIAYDNDANENQIDLITRIVSDLMYDLGNGTMTAQSGASEADVQILHNNGLIPIAGLVVDTTEYFWYHHSVADTMDKLDKDELADCAAALGVLAYVIADYPEAFNKL